MSESKKLTIDRKKNGELDVKYGGTPISNVSALSISVSPLGVMATIVFNVEEVDVETALHRIIGCNESDDSFAQLEIN